MTFCSDCAETEKNKLSNNDNAADKSLIEFFDAITRFLPLVSLVPNLISFTGFRQKVLDWLKQRN